MATAQSAYDSPRPTLWTITLVRRVLGTRQAFKVNGPYTRSVPVNVLSLIERVFKTTFLRAPHSFNFHVRNKIDTALENACAYISDAVFDKFSCSIRRGDGLIAAGELLLARYPDDEATRVYAKIISDEGRRIITGVVREILDQYGTGEKP